MKLNSVIKKSIKEQIRHFWLLILIVSMAPFFVFIYYLITEASKPHYDLLLVNQDRGFESASGNINYGDLLIETIKATVKDSFEVPLTVTLVANREEAEGNIKKGKADALIIIPVNFSQCLQELKNAHPDKIINFEFIGDVTKMSYMFSVIYTNEIINSYVSQMTNRINPVKVTETTLGISGSIDDFNYYVPGLLILSLIMLMFTASIALVTEVEHKTMLRLKLSKLSTLEFLSGVSIVQVLIGIISITLTLIVAVLLGFDYVGSIGILVFIATLTSISIIAFSLIVAAFTRTVNEVLVVGNFPLFLFMFFTGAAFPIKGKELFNIAGYSITVNGIMSPTHAIDALRKVMIMNMGFHDILPELCTLIILTIIYFIIGLWVFRVRHMRVV